MAISAKDLDPAFSKLSQKPGLDVWRIENGSPVLLPKAEHGKLFSKDAYIILKATGSKAGGVSFAIHYWLGKSISKEDAALASIKAADLDAALGGKAVQVRESQGHESDLFLSYFRPCVIPTNGAKGKPEGEGKEPTLYQVKGRRFLHIRQVPFARSSLTHSDVFVLDTKAKIFQFNGANTTKQERTKALDVALYIKDSSYPTGCEVAVVDDGKADDSVSNEFWDLFGGFAPIAKKGATEDDLVAKAIPPTLYWVSGDGLRELGSGTLKKLQLEGNKCYLIDTGAEVFVWFGRISPLDDRRAACVAAEAQLVTQKRPPSTRVTRVVERFETPAFKTLFADWPVVHAADGGSKLKAMLKQSGVTDKAVGGKAGAADEQDLPPLAEAAGDMKAWRLSSKEKVALAAADIGKFYSGDCYLVQYTFVRDRKNEYLMFLWVGKTSTAADRASGLETAVKAMNALRGIVTLIRVVQGKEPEQFLSLFKGNLFFYKGGLSPSYKASVASKGDDTFDPNSVALFNVRSRGPGLIKATQLDTVSKSLNGAETFLLLTPQHPFLWCGNSSPEADRTALSLATEVLKPGVAPKHLTEGKETSLFWTQLGGKGDYGSGREARETGRDPKLFQYTGTATAFKVLEVPNFDQEDLISDDVMILDTHAEVFVWVGSQAPEQQKKEAFDYGILFLDHLASTEGRSKDTAVLRVVEGFEPPMFTAYFPWDPIKEAVLMDPYQRRLALLHNRTLELSETARRRIGPGGGIASPRGSASHSPFSAAASTTPLPAAAAPAPAESASPSSSSTPSDSPFSISSQRAAALAALKGSISGVAVKPTEPQAALGASLAAAAPEALSSPTAEVAAAEGGIESPSASAASQRAAAIAALTGSLTAEKKLGKQVTPAAPPPTPAAAAAPATADPVPAAAAEAVTTAVAGLGIKEVEAVEGATFPLHRLTIDAVDTPVGLDTTKRESYLSDADFQKLFGSDKAKFYTQPKWKQEQRKKALGLF